MDGEGAAYAGDLRAVCGRDEGKLRVSHAFRKQRCCFLCSKLYQTEMEVIFGVDTAQTTGEVPGRTVWYAVCGAFMSSTFCYLLRVARVMEWHLGTPLKPCQLNPRSSYIGTNSQTNQVGTLERTHCTARTSLSHLSTRSFASLAPYLVRFLPRLTIEAGCCRT